MADVVAWSNGEHPHSGIRYVTPNDRHEGRDEAILAQRDTVYRAAKKRSRAGGPAPTRNWSPLGDVSLNPEQSPNAA